jgi:hypothetical protein
VVSRNQPIPSSRTQSPPICPPPCDSLAVAIAVAGTASPPLPIALLVPFSSSAAPSHEASLPLAIPVPFSSSPPYPEDLDLHAVGSVKKIEFFRPFPQIPWQRRKISYRESRPRPRRRKISPAPTSPWRSRGVALRLAAAIHLCYSITAAAAASSPAPPQSSQRYRRRTPHRSIRPPFWIFSTRVSALRCADGGAAADDQDREEEDQALQEGAQRPLHRPQGETQPVLFLPVTLSGSYLVLLVEPLISCSSMRVRFSFSLDDPIIVVC